MKKMNTAARMRRTLLVAALCATVATPALALKHAPREHNLEADASLPVWTPGPVKINPPEEDLIMIGSDIMDEITFPWAKMYREAYAPNMNVTFEARSSNSGMKGLLADAHLAPVGRELMPAEVKAFVDKYGYEPTPVKVATGSVGSLGGTASSVMFVDKDNPIQCLSLAQLDAVYSATRKRGYKQVTTWGDLDAKGEWASRPIHLYGLKPVNGIEQYIKTVVLQGGEFKDNIEFVKGKGFTHAFKVAAEDMAGRPGGLTYALLKNKTPNVKVLALSEKQGGTCYEPTIESVYTHKYPLSRFAYIYINRKPGGAIEPKVKEFLKMVLSKQGQDVVARGGVYIPLTPEIVKQELAKLD